MVAAFGQVLLLSLSETWIAKVVARQDVWDVWAFFVRGRIKTLICMPKCRHLSFLSLRYCIDVSSRILGHFDWFEGVSVFLCIDHYWDGRRRWVLIVLFFSLISSLILVSDMNSICWLVLLVPVLCRSIPLGRIRFSELVEYMVIFDQCQWVHLNALLIIRSIQSVVRPYPWRVGTLLRNGTGCIENLNWFLRDGFLRLTPRWQISLLFSAAAENRTHVNSHLRSACLRCYVLINLMQSLAKVVVLLIYFWKITIALDSGLMAVALALQFWQTLDLAHLVLRSVLDGQAEGCLRHRVDYLVGHIISAINRMHYVKYVRSTTIC